MKRKESCSITDLPEWKNLKKHASIINREKKHLKYLIKEKGRIENFSLERGRSLL